MWYLLRVLPPFRKNLFAFGLKLFIGFKGILKHLRYCLSVKTGRVDTKFSIVLQLLSIEQFLQSEVVRTTLQRTPNMVLCLKETVGLQSAVGTARSPPPYTLRRTGEHAAVRWVANAFL